MSRTFEKKYSYKFSVEELQKVLTYYLLAAGEMIPQPIYDSDGYSDFDPSVLTVCETDGEIIQDFDMVLSFDQDDINKYKEAYAKKGASLSPEPATELPDNVWTQGTALPCGKSECPIKEEEEE